MDACYDKMVKEFLLHHNSRGEGALFSGVYSSITQSDARIDISTNDLYSPFELLKALFYICATHPNCASNE